MWTADRRASRSSNSEVRRLSRGANTDVFEVRRAGRALIVKVLHSHASTEDRTRFENEVDALAAVRAPNVVRVERVLRDERGARALVMPRLIGRSARDWVSAFGPMPAPFAVSIFVDVLSGLDALHARGIVHRDVTPSNVFVGHEELEPATATRGIVIDLGIAKRADHPATTGAHVLGTTRYVSPEQILSGRIDARTDVWGSGVSLFEALTGRIAFPSDDPLDILAYDPLAQRGALAGLRHLEPVLRRALSKRPSDRYDTAANMRSALLESADGSVR